MLKVALAVLLVCLGQSGLSDYNATKGMKLYMNSIAGYCKQDWLKSWNCTACGLGYALTNVQVFGETDNSTLIYIGQSVELRAVVVVITAFILTEKGNSTYWLYQTRADYSYCSGCLVNDAMYTVYKRWEPVVFLTIRNLMSTMYRTVVATGFSIGGGLVNFLAAELYKNAIPTQSIYTYGATRVGNFNFMQWLSAKMFDFLGDSQIMRVTHGADPVPSALSSTVYGYYYHASHEIFYEKTFKLGYLECNDLANEDGYGTYQYTYRVWDDHFTYYDRNFNTDIADCRRG